MPLSKDQVEQIARLARLNLTADEIERFSHELTVILDYVDQLRGVDTNGVEPQNQFVQTENVFREDVVRPSLPQEMALANAPKKENGFFVVPKVIG
ncbi:MAG: Asp-tRNA(Asn)/Glu-tRNA(Gln) amidotransferase subunit GatC [Candidatus Zixiibacteriota bacterium]